MSKRKLLLIVIGLVLIGFFTLPIPIEAKPFCCNTEHNYLVKFTTVPIYFFGTQNCYHKQIDLTEPKPRGYCKQKGYSGTSRARNYPETEQCMVFEYQCDTIYSWWREI